VSPFLADPWCAAVLASAGFAWIAATARGLLGRDVGAPGAIAGAYGLLLGMALLGTFINLTETFWYVRPQPWESLPALLRFGVSVSMMALVFGSWFALPLVLLHLLGSLGRRARPAAPSRADRAAAVGLALLLGLGLMALLSGVGTAMSFLQLIEGNLPDDRTVFEREMMDSLRTGATMGAAMAIFGFVMMCGGLAVALKRGGSDSIPGVP